MRSAGKASRTLQLVQVGLRHDQLRRPFDFLLVLDIQRGHADRLRRVDFVLGEEFCRRQFKDIEAARNFRTVDIAVVPVGRPVAAQHQHLRIDRAAVEVGNLEWIARRR